MDSGMDVVPEAPIIRARRNKYSVGQMIVTVSCPYRDEVHTHGAMQGQEFPNHKVAHCSEGPGLNSGGYYVTDPLGLVR